MKRNNTEGYRTGHYRDNLLQVDSREITDSTEVLIPNHTIEVHNYIASHD